MPAREPVPIKFPPSEELAALFAKVVDIAERFPGVEVSRSYGTPAIKVKRRLLARLRSEAEGGLAIQCDFMDREMLLQAAPRDVLHHGSLRRLPDGAHQPRDPLLGRHARHRSSAPGGSWRRPG